MKMSQLFTKSLKSTPADEVAKNAQLLIRSGFIFKEMAGVYSMLPLGLKVLEKITAVVKREMDAIGGVQVQTSVLQNKDVWEQTDRWDDDVVDNWFKTKLKNGTELGLSFTNEEAYSNILKNFVHSYRDLPIYAYDFKTIFRNEIRSKSGLMRGREFYWKALYSFSTDQAQHDLFYEKIKEAYIRIFSNLGLGDITYLTFASGGTFSKYSHEFQTLSDAGEDTIYIDKSKKIAINKEVLSDEVLRDLGLEQSELVEGRAIEVGNIFSLGHKFSEPFGLSFITEDGQSVPVYMGSYGIGITRLMGTIVETLSDDKGIVWPVNIAPATVYIARLGEEEKVVKAADSLYQELTDKGIEVIYDDRDARAGEKFSDAELMGIPYRVVVSAKTVASGVYELKARTEDTVKMLNVRDMLAFLAKSK